MFINNNLIPWNNKYQQCTGIWISCSFFVVLWEFFSQMETSPLPVKVFKIWPFLGQLSHSGDLLQLVFVIVHYLILNFFLWKIHGHGSGAQALVQVQYDYILKRHSDDVHEDIYTSIVKFMASETGLQVPGRAITSKTGRCL